MPKNTATADVKPSIQSAGRTAPHIGNAISWTIALIIVAGGVATTVVRNNPAPLVAALSSRSSYCYPCKSQTRGNVR